MKDKEGSVHTVGFDSFEAMAAYDAQSIGVVALICRFP